MRPVPSGPGRSGRPVLAAAFAASLAVPTGAARADAAADVAGKAITTADGAQVYGHVCQGCHMANGGGGVGAGAIPALAHNPKLASSGYPIYVVLNGYGGMPWFNGMLSDAQVAAVVGFVRTHFGNGYGDAVTPAMVAQQRPPAPTMER